jgi:acyl carrier protein
MELNDFIEKLKEVLEIEDREINPTDIFRDYDEWDSLAYLSVIAYLDEEFEIQIEESDFKKLITIEDLYNITVK